MGKILQVSDKRTLKRSIRQLQVVKTWQLVILLVLAMFLAATFLRLNNTGMIARRNAVASADKTGDVEMITQRLAELQQYTSEHMNADTGTMYLQEQYNRDVQKQAQQASESGSERALEIRREAEAVCKPQFNGWSPAYVQCYVNELNKHPSDEVIADATPPSSSLYKYSFASPVWSPDFAGWSIVLVGLLAIAIVGRLLGLLILRIMLKQHYREL